MAKLAKSGHLILKMPSGEREIHPRLREFFSTRKFLPEGTLYRDDIQVFTKDQLKPVTITLQVRRILEANEVKFEKLSRPRIGFFGISVDSATAPGKKSEAKEQREQKARLRRFLQDHPEYAELLDLGIDAAHMGIDRFIEIGQAAAEARQKHVASVREHKRLLEEFGDLIALEDATIFIRRFITKAVSQVRRQPRLASELAGRFGVETKKVRELLEEVSARTIESLNSYADGLEGEAKQFKDETLRKRGDQGSGSYKRGKGSRTKKANP